MPPSTRNLPAGTPSAASASKRRPINRAFVYSIFERDHPDCADRATVDAFADAILALDDEDRVLLIRQYRHAIGTREWEIPAGLLDIDGDPPVIGAQRELAEEADVVGARWNLLSDFYSTPGGSNEAIRIYLARGLSDAHTAFERTDEESDIEKRWVPLDEVVAAVLDRTVGNSILSIAVLTAHVSRAAGWASLGAADAPWPRHPKLRGRD